MAVVFRVSWGDRPIPTPLPLGEQALEEVEEIGKASEQKTLSRVKV
jgi:hypothetical protein